MGMGCKQSCSYIGGNNMKYNLKIFGFMIALSFLIVLLYSWMRTEYIGDTYFRAGEPNRLILYTEWILGLLSITVISIEMKKIIDENLKEVYDPLV